jgi:hypothetical protein
MNARSFFVVGICQIEAQKPDRAVWADADADADADNAQYNAQYNSIQEMML